MSIIVFMRNITVVSRSVLYYNKKEISRRDDMYRKKRKTKDIGIILCVFIIATILLIFSLMATRKVTVVEDFLKTTTITFQKVVMAPFLSFRDKKGIDQSESYLIQKNVNESLEKEIKELKQTLQLNKTLTEYHPINATVLSRNRSYWLQNITIDKGSRDGLEEDMVVVTSDGLLGKISKAYKTSSEVKLITSNDINYKISVSVTTNSGDIYAVLNGYDKKSGTIKVTGVYKTSHVEVGNVIKTSGLGGMFPRGIYIGTIKEIRDDKYNLSKTLYVETKQNFDEIHYVTVLRGVEHDR